MTSLIMFRLPSLAINQWLSHYTVITIVTKSPPHTLANSIPTGYSERLGSNAWNMHPLRTGYTYPIITWTNSPVALCSSLVTKKLILAARSTIWFWFDENLMLYPVMIPLGWDGACHTTVVHSRWTEPGWLGATAAISKYLYSKLAS